MLVLGAIDTGRRRAQRGVVGVDLVVDAPGGEVSGEVIPALLGGRVGGGGRGGGELPGARLFHLSWFDILHLMERVCARTLIMLSSGSARPSGSAGA